MSRIFLKYFTVLMGLGFSLTAIAQAQDTTRLQLHEVEVMTKASAQTNKSTAPLQVVSATEMTRLGIQSMADAVRRFSGVVVKDYGGIGGLKTVSIRGFGAQHTGVSIDGITVSDAQSGQIDIGRFSLDNVSQISLETGQSDDIFQPARNFSSVGVLNITTKAPDFLNGSFTGDVRIKAGSFGQFNPSFFLGKKLKDDLSITLHSDWQRADGNYPFTFKTGVASSEDRKRYNSDVNIFRIESNVYKNWNNRGELNFKASYFDSKRGLPGSAVSVNTYAAERLLTRTFFSQLGAKYKLSEKLSWRASAKMNSNYDRYTDKSIKYEDGTLENRFRQYEYYATTTLLYRPMDDLQLSVAQDYAHNYIYMIFRASGITDINYPPRNKAYRNTGITALNAKYEMGRLLVQANVLGAYYGERAHIGDRPIDKKRITPALALSYEFLEGWHARLSYKDIYRVPTFNDMYYTQIGNRGLKPELARQTNAGITFKKYFPNHQQAVNVSIDGYYNKVKDKIVAIPTMFVWKMQNVDKVRIQGADVKASYERTLCDGWRMFVSGSYSYQDAENTDSKQQIIYTPKHSGNASLALENPWVNVSYTMVGCGYQWTANYHSKLNKLDGYTDHSLSLNRSFQWNRHQLKLQLDLLNLTNKNYEVIKNYPMPGRSFMASGTWAF